MADFIDPSKMEEFKLLQLEGKRLASVGDLRASLQKFELAKQICSTPKVLQRIEKLKTCLGIDYSKINQPEFHLSSTSSPLTEVICEIPSSSIGGSKTDLNICSSSTKKDSKVLCDIQNIQICEEVVPSAELDTSAVHLFENEYLSTDLKLYYCTNFIELEKIAEGGFGAVYKAQYKLNKLIYAVKKIPFDYKTDANFWMIKREANNFAALNHLNIVRYYSAWIEMADSDAVNKSLSENVSFIPDFSKENIAEQYNGLVIKERSSKGISDCLSTKRVDTDSVIFLKSGEASTDVNWMVKNHSNSFSDHSDEDKKNDSTYHNNNEDLSISNFKIQGVLYIQMEYCDCDLQFWLDKRAETKGKDLPFEMDVGEIFSNIVKGVAHIHSRGIIHRDLKPHNIFYSQYCNTVKIGDFGLATLSGFAVDASNSTSHGHSSAIGTVPYAAPEQMKSNKYDMKVDIYSLGIILIELTNICSTRAEFFHIIQTVKNGIIKEGMKKYPILGNLAKALISDNPENRMPAKDILNLLDKDSKIILKEVVMNEFSTKLKENEETIRNLAEIVKNMQATIIQQHSEISRLNSEIIKLNSGI